MTVIVPHITPLGFLAHHVCEFCLMLPYKILRSLKKLSTDRSAHLGIFELNQVMLDLDFLEEIVDACENDNLLDEKLAPVTVR